MCSGMIDAGWADEGVDYEHDIKPLLKERCYACHGPLAQESGLRLDTAAAALRGGDSGTAIVPGDAEGSLLVRRVSSADELERMPPEGQPLSDEEIEILKAWIDQGAASPADEQPQADPREHWAFRPPVRPALPRPIPRPRAASRAPPTRPARARPARRRRSAPPAAPAPSPPA